MARDPITIRWLVGLMWPGGWVFLAAWAFQQEELAVEAIAPYAAFFAFGSLGAALLLSWYYSYGRVFFVAAAAVLALWAVQQSPEGSQLQASAAVLLLPVNFGLFAWWKERGVTTPGGIPRLAFLAAQAVAVALLVPRQAGWLEPLLRWREPPGSGLLPAQQLAFAVAAVVVLVLIFRRGTKAEQDLFWVLAAAFAGLSQAGKTEATWLYFGGAGLVLLSGVLERGYHIAYRDELTGLPGRRALNELLLRLGSQYAIAMCDVDHFKKFNDSYGHDAGDQVLRMVAAKLSRVKGGGQVFRYGGEEFAVVFRGRSASEALPYVESLRAAVAGTQFTLRRPDRPREKPASPPASEPANPGAKPVVTITISIGVAEPSRRHSTPELVLDAADAALYRAKEAGRNCTRLAEGAPSEPAG